MQTGPSNAERLRTEREARKRRDVLLAACVAAERDLRRRRQARNAAWDSHGKRLQWIAPGAVGLTAAAARQTEVERLRVREPERLRALMDISPAPGENVQKLVEDWLRYSEPPGPEGVGTLVAAGQPRAEREAEQRAGEAAALRERFPVLASSTCVLVGLLREGTA